MADTILTDVGVAGGIADMSAANLLSRTVEDSAGIAFGLPVKQGTNDHGCTAGLAAGNFIGITVAESPKSQFNQYDDARVMDFGAIWLTAGGTIAAGDPIMCTAAGVYNKYVATTASNFKLDGYAETSASSGALFKLLLNSTNAVAA